jgi:PAS domain S-box-containing protein
MSSSGCTAMNLGQPASYEFFFPPLDTWFEQRLYPTPFGLSQFSVPIDERKRREQEREGLLDALHRSEQAQRVAVEAAEIGTWDFDPVSGRLQWSDRCKELFGLPPEAAVDYDACLALVHVDDRSRVDQIVQAALDPLGSGEYETEYRTAGRDGAVRLVLATGRAFFVDVDGARRAVRCIGTVIDVTERRRAEEALQQKMVELERMNRAMLGREVRMAELKEEVNRLLAAAGEPPRYPTGAAPGAQADRP